MRRLLLATSLTMLALGSAAPVSAHAIVVDPSGAGSGTGHHVGQAPPGHHSCFGLSTAAAHEASSAVTFLGPSITACPR